MKIKKQNILINNAGAGFLISSTGVIDSTGAWGCSHQIYYSFSASARLLRIHSLLITISSSSRRSLKSLQCEEANSYILSMSTAPVISPLLDYKEPKLYDVVPKEEIAEFEEVMRKTIADIVSEASGVACWVYVQKYVKHKTLDDMLQEWSEASQFVLVMNTWFERLMADQYDEIKE